MSDSSSEENEIKKGFNKKIFILKFVKDRFNATEEDLKELDEIL